MNEPAVIRDPASKADFYLYLPAGYVSSRTYPLVIVLHGLNPYDTWDRQIASWQEAADEYQFMVVCPKLESMQPGMASTFAVPIRNPSMPEFLNDTEAVLSIRDHCIATYNADPNRVWMTSWSAGGYLANYIITRHPEKFAALALWGSNWDANLVDRDGLPRMRNLPVWIGWGEFDFVPAGIVNGSRQAAEFYRKHGVLRVQEYEDPNTGHQRRPNLVATFFFSATRPRPAQEDVQLLLSTNVGLAPLMVSFSARLPADLVNEDVSYTWLFGQQRVQISTQENGTKWIFDPGVHPIEVLVTSRSGRQWRATADITVLDEKNVGNR